MANHMNYRKYDKKKSLGVHNRRYSNRMKYDVIQRVSERDAILKIMDIIENK